jgi:chorismate--pyruvate lyase
MMRKTSWQPFNALLNPPAADLSEWLRDPASFMQRLKRHGILGAKIQVLNQGWKLPSLEERKLLSLRERHLAMVREVLIASVEGQWMFARTIFPASTLTGKEQKFLRLKNRPLGTMLFSDPSMRRSEFYFARLQAGSDWHKRTAEHVAIAGKDCWARHSVFHISNKPLLLTEVFLPPMANLKC